MAGYIDAAFVSRRFSNMKDATSESESIPPACVNDDAQGSSRKDVNFACHDKRYCRNYLQLTAENRKCLLKKLSNMRFLARHGCAISGTGDETGSSFFQLYKLLREDDRGLENWLIKKREST